MNRCCFFFIALVVYVGSHGSSGATYELKQGGNTCLIVDTTATLRVAYTDTAGRDVSFCQVKFMTVSSPSTTKT